jgi:uncharacterized membrane protein
MLENKWFRAGLIGFVIFVIAFVQIRQALEIERFSNITLTAGFNTEFRLIGLTNVQKVILIRSLNYFAQPSQILTNILIAMQLMKVLIHSIPSIKWQGLFQLKLIQESLNY